MIKKVRYRGWDKVIILKPVDKFGLKVLY